MPQDLFRNSQICSMVAEGEVANILSHFDSDYVMSVIHDHLVNRFTYSSAVMTKPNIVVSYNMTFRNLEQMYPLDAQNIREVEQASYQEIIDTICQFYGFQFIPPADDTDLFTIALYMYECFVSKFDAFVSQFYANFIMLNKDALWDALELVNYKKDKDVTTVYGKKAYDDVKMAIICAKMNEVLYYLKGLDIDLLTFLQTCYPIEYAQLLADHVKGENFYATFIATAIDVPSVVTDIKLKIHNTLCTQNDISVLVPQPEENGDTTSEEE